MTTLGKLHLIQDQCRASALSFHSLEDGIFNYKLLHYRNAKPSTAKKADASDRKKGGVEGNKPIRHSNAFYDHCDIIL